MLNNLTGIRGIAALWVWTGHYNEYFTRLFPILTKLDFIYERGKFGVDLFFCLSGFILGYVYFDHLTLESSKATVKLFFYKRMARLYPVYIFTLSLAMLFYLLAILSGHKFNHESSANLNIFSALQNFLGVQAWFSTPSLNGPSWSVSAEFAAYILFPFLVTVIAIGKWNLRISAATLLVLSLMFYQFSLHRNYLLNQQIAQVFSEFTMGLCAYLVFRNSVFSITFCRNLRLLFLVILFSLLYYVKSDLLLESVLPVLLLILITLNFQHNIYGKGLSRSSFVTLGLWSYSLYMTHRLLQNVMSGLSLPIYTSNLFIRTLEFTLLIFIPLLSAFLVTKYLENPARIYLLKKWR